MERVLPELPNPKSNSVYFQRAVPALTCLLHEPLLAPYALLSELCIPKYETKALGNAQTPTLVSFSSEARFLKKTKIAKPVIDNKNDKIPKPSNIYTSP